MQSSRHEETNKEVKSSVTAISVAMAFSRAIASKYSHLFSQQELALSNHLWQTGRLSLKWFNWGLTGLISSAPYSLQQSFFNNLIVPAYDEVLLLRKLMISHKIQDAIDNGTNQIVFLGGGYDIRAFITAINNPDVKIFELDRGKTRDSKVKGLMSIPNEIGFGELEMQIDTNGSLNIGKNLSYLECDLVKDDLAAILKQNGFSPDKKSLIIGEGLTPYLSKLFNTNLSNNVCNLLNQDSEYLISYVYGLKEVGSLEKNALDEADETYLFSLKPNDVIPFMSESNLAVCQKFDGTKRISELDETCAKPYQSKSNLPKEVYYLLRKADKTFYLSIDEVPEIEFDLPQNNFNLNESWTCRIS